LLLGARLALLPRPATGLTLTGHHTLLLHLLREVLRATAQRLQGPPLRIDSAVRIALPELPFSLAHGLAGFAELVTVAGFVALALLSLLALALLSALPLLAPLTLLSALLALLTLLSLLPHTAFVHFLGQLVEPITQCLLLLLQVCHVLLALLALLTLLALWRTLLASWPC